MNEATCTWSGQLPPRNYKNPIYSCKVFLGGVPWDITEGELPPKPAALSSEGGPCLKNIKFGLEARAEVGPELRVSGVSEGRGAFCRPCIASVSGAYTCHRRPRVNSELFVRETSLGEEH